MNDDARVKQVRVAKLVAAAALTLFALSNLAWAVAYSSLSRRSIGVEPAATTSPSASPVPSRTASPSPSPVSKGTIAGALAYPGGKLPAQTVCAVSTADANAKYCIDHPGGSNNTYTLGLPAGTYYVYASLKSAQGDYTPAYRAYYNQFVVCGMTAACGAELHNQPVAVSVPVGTAVNDINPTDWYGPAQ